MKAKLLKKLACIEGKYIPLIYKQLKKINKDLPRTHKHKINDIAIALKIAFIEKLREIRDDRD